MQCALMIGVSITNLVQEGGFVGNTAQIQCVPPAREPEVCANRIIASARGCNVPIYLFDADANGIYMEILPCACKSGEIQAHKRPWVE